jgi:hypothetical protein
MYSNSCLTRTVAGLLDLSAILLGTHLSLYYFVTSRHFHPDIHRYFASHSVNPLEYSMQSLGHTILVLARNKLDKRMSHRCIMLEF